MRLALLAAALILVIGGALALSLGSRKRSPGASASDGPETQTEGGSSAKAFSDERMQAWYESFSSISAQIGPLTMAAGTPQQGERLLGLVREAREELPGAVDKDIESMARSILEVAEEVARECVLLPSSEESVQARDGERISVHRMALPTFVAALEEKMANRYGAEARLSPHWQLAP